MFKIIPTVRGGTTNSPRIFERYATVHEARESSKQLIHESGRVTRVMIVADEETPRFMEWIERS